MVNKVWLKEIIENLISSTERLGNYSKRDLERTILECRGSDPRTTRNWFNALFKLEYLFQPVNGIFELNLSKVIGLDIKVPTNMDLRTFVKDSTLTHTKSVEATE